jgi:hypothetical protein
LADSVCKGRRRYRALDHDRRHPFRQHLHRSLREDAKAFAAESFDVKKPLEVADEKEKNEKLSEDDEDDSKVSFKENPVDFVRQKVFTFVDLAKLDPILAFKSHPETGAGLLIAGITLFGMLGVLLGVVGASQKPITKVTFLVIILTTHSNADVVVL